MNKLLPALLPFTLLTACGGGNRDYMPEPGTSAEKMFEQACLECHEIDADGKYSNCRQLRLTPVPLPNGFRAVVS